MRYEIKYCVVCSIGKKRAINQDNFYADGIFLDSGNNGLEIPICESISAKKMPVFAVFDGMGGEVKGEVASLIASNMLHTLHCREKGQSGREYFESVCNQINSSICDYAAEHRLSTMGTTGAFVAFEKDRVSVCNIGDSPIFRFSDGGLAKISQDHVEEKYYRGKPPLTQFLGVPESDFIIEPYIVEEEPVLGDKYLICSDGLTDMVSLNDIRDVIASSLSVENASELLLKKALDSGGKDNITIILCEIYKKKFWI